MFPLCVFPQFVLYSNLFWEHPGIIQEPPRISLEAAGVSKDHFEGILWWRNISRNPKIMTIYFSMFPAAIVDETRPIRLVLFPYAIPITKKLEKGKNKLANSTNKRRKTETLVFPEQIFFVLVICRTINWFKWGTETLVYVSKIVCVFCIFGGINWF